MSLADKVRSEAKDIVLLTEVKINRHFDYHFKNGFIIMSAFRGDNDLKTNKKLSTQLLTDITSLKYSYLPLYGGYIENKGTGEEREVREVSFLIPKKQDGNITSLFELGKTLCAKYNQNVFLFKNEGNDKKSQFITSSGNIEAEFSSLNLNDISQTYFTKLSNSKNSKKADRRITFTNEVFIRTGSKTINGYHVRNLKGEIQIIEYGN